MDDAQVARESGIIEPAPEAVRQASPAAARQLVLDTISVHADALLRTARRHSLCLDDAQDAYQRGLEIFMRHAPRLDADRAPAWLHTVVKHEAMAVRRSRQKLVGAEEVDLDAHEARHLPSVEEQIASFDVVTRSAEALQHLKPQEVRALWLQMQGLSYREIAIAEEWTYTKVNRCITEGRRAFLTRYAGIEAGQECERWEPVLSAMVDGEAASEDVVGLRPHLRNCPSCRATLRALRETRPALQAVLPVGLLAVVTPEAAETSTSFVARVYEAVAGMLQERTAALAVKTHTLLEASAAAKVTAVAASAAAVAGGGVATVERVQGDPAPARPVASVQDRTRTTATAASARPAATTTVVQAPAEPKPAPGEAPPTRPDPVPSPAASTPASAAPEPPESRPRARAEFTPEAATPTGAAAGPARQAPGPAATPAASPAPELPPIVETPDPAPAQSSPAPSGGEFGPEN